MGGVGCLCSKGFWGGGCLEEVAVFGTFCTQRFCLKVTHSSAFVLRAGEGFAVPTSLSLEHHGDP